MSQALAISLRQPLPWAILSGHCPIIRRAYGTRHRGRLLIHASRQMDHNLRRWIQRTQGVSVPPGLPRGGIVGEVELVDVVEWHPSTWFDAGVALVITNPRPRPLQVCPGARGLFQVAEQQQLEV